VRLLWIVLTTVIIVVAAGAPLVIWKHTAAAPALSPAVPSPGLEPEQHYYVFLTVVEVEPRDADGDAWDSRGGAPDLYYKIRWQGQTVFESSTKDDTLVAKWTNVSVELGDVVEAVSLDDSIKAARITARPGDTLEFSVYDKDTTSGDDLVGAWTVPVASLHAGDQQWEKPGGCVVAATCRVIPIDDVRFETLTR